MPKTQLDWLAVVSLWVGALIEAVKAGDLPLMGGFPEWLGSHLWGYVPAILVTFYIGIAVFRGMPRNQGKADEELLSDGVASGTLNNLADAERLRKHEDWRVIRLLEQAGRGAKFALNERDLSWVEKEVPTMRAAMLSLLASALVV